MYFLLYHQISLESFLLKNCFLNVTKHDFINYVFVKGFKDVQRACGNKYGNSWAGEEEGSEPGEWLILQWYFLVIHS